MKLMEIPRGGSRGIHRHPGRRRPEYRAFTPMRRMSRTPFSTAQRPTGTREARPEAARPPARFGPRFSS